MSNDILEDRRKQMRGSTKEWWGEFTDSDLDRIAGKRDMLADALQEEYGDTLEKADKKIERRLRDAGQKHIASALRTRRMDKRQSIGW